jgi:ketosteroid isomerase-like protein
VVSTVNPHSEAQLERLFDALSSDVELDLSELIDGRVLRGRDSVQAYVRSLRDEVWAEFTMNAEAIQERDDVVVAAVRCHAVGRASGVPVDFPAAWVATLRDGLVTSARFTLDQEAAGLPG